MLAKIEKANVRNFNREKIISRKPIKVIIKRKLNKPKMKHLLQLLAFTLIFTSCADRQKENKKASLPPISEVYDSFYEGSLVLNPLYGNRNGINRYLDRMPNNLTDEFRAKEVALYQLHLDKMHQTKLIMM
jgi:hypothetical protein